MTRLDQLSRPIRRNGEHISAIVEREKRMHLEANGEQPEGSLGGGDKKRMSRSMTHLAATSGGGGVGGAKRSSSGLQKSATTARVGGKSSLGGGGGSSRGSGLKPAKSLCHLDGSGGPGFHKIITKVAQHFIRNGNARGRKPEDASAKSGSWNLSSHPIIVSG